MFDCATKIEVNKNFLWRLNNQLTWWLPLQAIQARSFIILSSLSWLFPSIHRLSLWYSFRHASSVIAKHTDSIWTKSNGCREYDPHEGKCLPPSEKCEYQVTKHSIALTCYAAIMASITKRWASVRSISFRTEWTIAKSFLDFFSTKVRSHQLLHQTTWRYIRWLNEYNKTCWVLSRWTWSFAYYYHFHLTHKMRTFRWYRSIVVFL